MAKQRRTSKTNDEGEVRNKCVESVVNFNDEQTLINALEWIKFKANKHMFTPEEVATLIKLTADFKQIKP